MKKLPPAALFAILVASLAAACLYAFSSGAANIGIFDIPQILSSKTPEGAYIILTQVRLPRVLLGLAVGSSLALAGVLLQGLFKNPLVEPYTIGVSGGAALCVAITIVCGINAAQQWYSLPVAGLVGALCTMMLISALATRSGTIKIQGLLLTGVMISFISSSLVMLIMALAKTHDMNSIVFWSMGSLNRPMWTLVALMSFVSVVCLVISYRFCLSLNALALGYEEAAHLGVDVNKTRRWLFVLGAVLTGTSVSLAGNIGFVGLVVPHAVRLFAGNNHKRLLVCSYVLGGAFLVVCDTLARTVIAPVELPTGILTGIIGGTCFIVALWQKGQRV